MTGSFFFVFASSDILFTHMSCNYICMSLYRACLKNFETVTSINCLVLCCQTLNLNGFFGVSTLSRTGSTVFDIVKTFDFPLTYVVCVA